MRKLPYSPQPRYASVRVGWRDALLFVAFFALMFGVLHLAHAMRAPFLPGRPLPIDLSPAALPGYAARSLFRMYLAFGASVLFSLVYGYIAAYNRRAE